MDATSFGNLGRFPLLARSRGWGKNREIAEWVVSKNGERP